MPIYEYSCASCGKKFEVLVSGNQKVACEFCGSRKVKKLFSAFAVHGGPTTGAKSQACPSCAGGCGGGFEKGSCGSGMCRGG